MNPNDLTNNNDPNQPGSVITPGNAQPQAQANPASTTMDQLNTQQSTDIPNIIVNTTPVEVSSPAEQPLMAPQVSIDSTTPSNPLVNPEPISSSNQQSSINIDAPSIPEQFPIMPVTNTPVSTTDIPTYSPTEAIPTPPIIQPEMPVQSSIPSTNADVSINTNQANPINPQGQAPYSDYFANGAKPGNTLGILSLILAVIFPLAGLVLGIISSIKGFKHSNKILGIMGVASILLSIVAGIVYSSLLMKFINSSYDIGPLTSKTETIAGSSIKMDIPSKLTRTEENEAIAYRMNEKSTDGKTGAVAQVVMSISKGTTDAESIDSIKYFVDRLADEESKEFILALNDGLKSGIDGVVCSNVTLDNPQKISIESTSFAIKSHFVCDVSGGTKNYVGNIYDFGNDKAIGVVIVASDKKIWDSNQDKMSQIEKSIKPTLQ